MAGAGWETMLVNVKPHAPALLQSLGRMLGEVDTALASFDHLAVHRRLKWDLTQAGWAQEHLDTVGNPKRRSMVQSILNVFSNETSPALRQLPHSVTHNDANDFNVLVHGVGYDARVTGLIDFGDAVCTPTICNLAIALAYAMLGKRDPLAAAAHVTTGYHAAHALSAEELIVLWSLVRTRLCVSVVNSAIRKSEDPHDPYISISETPAWELLDHLESVHPRLAHYTLRDACGLPAVAATPAVESWLRNVSVPFASLVTPSLHDAPALVFDLSIGSLDLGLADELTTTRAFTDALFANMSKAIVATGIGRYDEPRLIYANDDFATMTEDGIEYRTVHLGLDVFQPAGSQIFAPLDGEVHSFADNTARLDYGPCIVLKHEPTAGVVFYTLYGHLSRSSLADLHVGQRFTAGSPLATMGDYPINGDWPPHLHFQIITDLLGFSGTFPGVARPSDRNLWRSLSPDANLIARVPADRFPQPEPTTQQVGTGRALHMGHNLSISYREPIHMARGRAQYLFDTDGRKYLDVYNNVPHVGHNHPYIVRAAQRQLAVLNTNTRYLQSQSTRYTTRLASMFPPDLSVVYMTASGSEATELALRLARAHSRSRDLIVSDGAYHGHTTSLIDISPYKAEGPGGLGLPDWVHKADVPDIYRGKYRATSVQSDADCASLYTRDLKALIDAIVARCRGFCGYIIESIPSVAGQIVLPTGYLAAAYAHVRAAGGVCIADEVQTGFGRIGTHLWAFEQYGVIPDIVALGKPIGNGYPMGAVITSPAIAASFDNGMEFFSTFGGSTVACAVGDAMLDVLQHEHLMEHARVIGDSLLTKLRDMQATFPILGDVRGLGMMLGVELVLDQSTRAPATMQASYICNRMKDTGILIGSDGPFHNVLKIRGPLCLTATDVDAFIATLATVLNEDGAR